MFVDQVKLEIFGGKGGDGIVAYRRELCVELGGPFGGNGGRGGSIIFVGDEGLSTLLDLRYAKVLKGLQGERGKHKGMYGRNSENTYIRVPVGTIIFDEKSNLVIADITKNKQEAVIAKGGRGGRGNMAFQTQYNKCPDYAENGEPGEHRFVRLELKILADCGLVGFPSVGKSTLINAVSNCKAKIGSYHFTTIVPNIGMVRLSDGRDFVMADLPGIIENASTGAGLGLQFLRHIERCKVIVHVLDMAESENRDVVSDYKIINEELKNYKMNLINRPQIVVANKMDLPNSAVNLERFIKETGVTPIAISAYSHVNLNELLYKIADTLDVTETFSLFEEDEREFAVNYTFEPLESLFDIEQQSDGIYNITGGKVERIFQMTDFNNESSVKRFARQLRSFGVDDELRRRGVQAGDTVRIHDFEFEFQE